MPALALIAGDIFGDKASRFGVTSSSGKSIVFFPLPNESVLIYVSEREYPVRALYSYLRSFASMILAFSLNFMRGIHICGMHIHNMFGAPQYYPRPLGTEAPQLLNELATAISPRCALYAQNMIVLATEQYWTMAKRDLHALDLLVRHSEAPFTLQRFTRDDSSTERASVFHVFKSMRFVCVTGDGFDPLSAASNQLPDIFRRHEALLKQLEPAPPIVTKQDGIVAWCVHDLVTHRFFGDVPAEEDQRMIAMVAKCYEIVDENLVGDFAPGDPARVAETMPVNRVKDISFRLHDHMFFYMPQVAVQRTFRDPNLWSMYILHDLKRDVQQMRAFAMETMGNMSEFVRPVIPVAPYLKEIANRQ
jgi:hypothetical protein